METVIYVVVALVAFYIIFRIFKTLVKWLLIAVVVLLVIAYFSNPDEFEHKVSVKEITSKLPVKVGDNAISVKDYKIFSVTKVKVHGEEKITGVGAFGKVWQFDDLAEKLK